jgi:dTDP-4-amino-4,6-dideoxygalactose transaminase
MSSPLPPAAAPGVAADATPGAAPAPIPFNRPHTTGHEFGYIQEAIENGQLSGNGPFTARCAAWLEDNTGSQRALLTSSCTAALEMAVILADIGPGDEVVMPSFTFVSTASAVALRGGIPVFVDIDPATLNIDERLAADAVTDRTRAIFAVHYAGVACEMGPLASLCERHGLELLEDAAQGLLSRDGDRALGGIGAAGCLSFHETKNVTCGEGGALLVNRADWVERAEILQEKGTNRSQFFRGEVDKYTWVDLGSSFLMGEINAAFLWAQIERAEEITAARLALWEGYHERFADLEAGGALRRPHVPEGRTHNAHMYYLLLEDGARRDRVIQRLREQGIHAVFHYIPLHSSPAGLRYGRAHGDLRVTDDASARLVRLPLWVGMSEGDVERVAGVVRDAVTER